jgi:hypothetical protein
MNLGFVLKLGKSKVVNTRVTVIFDNFDQLYQRQKTRLIINHTKQGKLVQILKRFVSNKLFA